MACSYVIAVGSCTGTVECSTGRLYLA